MSKAAKIVFFIMKSFNVINWNPNKQKFEAYNVIPYLINSYNNCKKEGYKRLPTTYEEFKDFVIDEARYQFWGRCEYEIILVDWPCQKTEEKWDVFEQIMMNIDIITNIVIEECK